MTFRVRLVTIIYIYMGSYVVHKALVRIMRLILLLCVRHVLIEDIQKAHLCRQGKYS